MNGLINDAARQATPTVELYPLDGVLAKDAEALARAADDFGHIVHLPARAVLKAGSEEDVVRAVRYARRRGVKIAPRGLGHSGYGQAQVADGLLLDMSSLTQVHSIKQDRLTIGAGARWRVAVDAAIGRGMIPPVLTDYLDLTVGGTLSVGGVGRATHRYGLQVDNVLELDVVTGEGECLTCSRESNRELFEATLAGLGQCAIILRATLRLIPAPSGARSLQLIYRDLGAFLQDQIRLAEDGRVDSILGMILPDPTRGWMYALELGIYRASSGADVLTDADLFSLLSGSPEIARSNDSTFEDHIRSPGAQLEGLKATGEWDKAHPWFDAFVPASAMQRFIEEARAFAPPAGLDSGFTVVVPLLSERVGAPLARVPSERAGFVIDVARFTARGEDVLDIMLRSNRALYELSSRYGGAAYPSGAIPMTGEDWRIHFGRAWGNLVAAKRRYDPGSALGG
jgi:FAD/FMN-containing dehydrogenase